MNDVGKPLRFFRGRDGDGRVGGAARDNVLKTVPKWVLACAVQEENIQGK